jgi:hypothetical protein
MAAAALAAALVAGAAHAQFDDPADPGANVPRPPPSFEPPAGPRGVPQRIDPALRFTNRERDQFERWAVAEYGRGKCPPGLAKRERACIPRGHSRKRYTVGQPLPAAVVPAPVPLDLTRRLGTPPIGYRYGMIDGDLVKLAIATGVAVDAVDGFIPK